MHILGVTMKQQVAVSSLFSSSYQTSMTDCATLMVRVTLPFSPSPTGHFTAVGEREWLLFYDPLFLKTNRKSLGRDRKFFLEVTPTTKGKVVIPDTTWLILSRSVGIVWISSFGDYE